MKKKRKKKIWVCLPWSPEYYAPFLSFYHFMISRQVLCSLARGSSRFAREIKDWGRRCGCGSFGKSWFVLIYLTFIPNITDRDVFFHILQPLTTCFFFRKKGGSPSAKVKDDIRCKSAERNWRRTSVRIGSKQGECSEHKGCEGQEENIFAFIRIYQF